MAAALADRLGEARLGAAELVHQPAVGLGLLERRQILALQILHQRDFDTSESPKRADNDRNLVHPDALRRAPAPLAGDQLEIGVVLGDRPHQQRLHDALLADRLGQRLSSSSAKWRRGWNGAGPDRLDRHDAALRCAPRIGRPPSVSPNSAARPRPSDGARRSLAAPHRGHAAMPPRRSISAASRI